MSDDGEGSSDAPDAADPTVRSPGQISAMTDRFVHGVELVAAAVFALLFAIGVVDLMIQIWQATLAGRITDPLVVIGFIDTGLLLLIIVEVYETVIAYTEESETRRIVRLVIYTGVIAMVRKTIIFRTGEYATAQDALFAAVGYTVLIFGLVGLLLVERGHGQKLMS
ncbi:phosphate-starvation-inducible PsiE family protein [Haloplanus litoreus]|uniref:Phosphate-starvation-inducible PsiE family protein n=1 Tax=Haloplanus litoreus TaxID=767515 RepID=A0ABD5ZVI4_9EURY